MLTDWSYVVAVTIMAAAAFATRIAGPVLMSWVTPTERTERFLRGLSVSVIAALVASLLVHADTKTILATALAITVVGLTRSVVGAMFAGMVAAALFPLLVAL